MLINCKSSGCNVCLVAAGKPPQCYLLAVRGVLQWKEKGGIEFTVGILFTSCGAAAAAAAVAAGLVEALIWSFVLFKVIEAIISSG